MGKKVFLIEDEVAIMDVYKTALDAADIDVVGIFSGKMAMEKVKEVQEGKKEKPALVLLDLVLPDINGLEILYALRKNEVTKDVVIFILSNYSSDALHGMEYIKPDKIFLKSTITPSMLVQIVSEQLKITAK